MQPKSHVPRLALTIEEAGESLSLSKRAVYELIRAGRLRAKTYGSRILVPVDSVADLVQSLPDVTGPIRPSPNPKARKAAA